MIHWQVFRFIAVAIRLLFESRLANGAYLFPESVKFTPKIINPMELRFFQRC
jgi:hypothetical protein